MVQVEVRVTAKPEELAELKISGLSRHMVLAKLLTEWLKEIPEGWDE